MRKITTPEFINRSKAKHGDKYNYSLSEYINSQTKLTIICPEHGEFTQLANDHMRGIGCRKCYDSNREVSSTAKVIKGFKKTHGLKYDYSKVEYLHSKTKVCIICPEHGEFWQIPNDHKRGIGCPFCGGVGVLNTETFIGKCLNVHDSYYNYSKVKYINNKTKVCIICPEHGEFWQLPSNHMSGHKCTKCGNDNIRIKLRLSTEQFIKKASTIHKNSYDYSEVKYKNNKTKVCIICPEHGEFWQTPNAHLRDHGCPTCNINSKGEKKLAHILKNNGIKYSTQKSFKGCVHIGTLNYDFYIPSLNTCIEYDGIQHFKPIEYFGGLTSFLETKIRDKIKYRYCKDNHINLIRIPYYTDIEQVLKSHKVI